MVMPFSCWDFCCQFFGRTKATADLSLSDTAARPRKVSKVALDGEIIVTLSDARSRTKKKTRRRVRSLILEQAVVKQREGREITVGVLCVDEGSWPEEVRTVQTDAGFKHSARCKGVTREVLEKRELSEEALQAIRECYLLISSIGDGQELHGVSGDLGHLWLKHHAAVRKVITDVPVYLTPIIQLPMISACFKSFEQTLLITWGLCPDLERMKQQFIEDCSMRLELDRLEVMGVNDEDPMWKRYVGWGTTVEEDLELGEALVKQVRERVMQTNAGKKDKLIKALIVTARLSIFSDMLRAGTGLPVFDEVSLLRFFASASTLSHYNDANVLARLARRVKPDQYTPDNRDKSNGDNAGKIGLVQLDYHFPPAFGDVDHPGTFGFKMLPRMVKGLFFEKAQEGCFDAHILENMATVIRELEEQKVVGITGNCGFMMHYQCFARFVARVPVFMSALIQAATMAAAMESNERVLILTANGESLQPGKDKLLLQSGIEVTNSDRFVIHGCQHIPGFEAVANAERVDTIKVQEHLSRYVKQILEEEGSRTDGLGPIRMILLECTELPHYSDELRRVTRLPVLDAVTCVNFFYRATATVNWNSDTFAPHNPDFWRSHFDKAGHVTSPINLTQSDGDACNECCGPSSPS